MLVSIDINVIVAIHYSKKKIYNISLKYYNSYTNVYNYLYLYFNDGNNVLIGIGVKCMLFFL